MTAGPVSHVQVGVLGVGLGSVVGGRLIDRVGTGHMLAGTVADLTGDREWAVAIAFGAAATGAVVMGRGIRAARVSEEPVAGSSFGPARSG